MWESNLGCQDGNPAHSLPDHPDSLYIKYMYFSILVGGTFVTVRGCAPFDTESFSPGMQRAMSGTYWKGFNIFAMCDYDNCNTATTGTQAKTGLTLKNLYHNQITFQNVHFFSAGLIGLSICVAFIIQYISNIF